MNAKLSRTGCLWIDTKLFEDDRGYFTEAYKLSEYNEMFRSFYPETSHTYFFQDNISLSKKNVVRGLHYQSPFQGKLIRVLQGSVIDAVIDIRTNSKTFGFLETFYLEEGGKHLYVPPGFAHGFWALDDKVLFSYKCTCEYQPSGESGINPLDEEYSFPWLKLKDEILIAPKDLALPLFNEVFGGKSEV